MKIRFLKDHVHNKQGEEIEEGAAAANYLIRVGVAEEVKEYAEKVEMKKFHSEKRENKTGNVPTAKMKAKKK